LHEHLAQDAKDFVGRKWLAEMRNGDTFKEGARLVAEGVARDEREPPLEVGIPALDLSMEGGAIEIGHPEITQDHVVGTLGQSLEGGHAVGDDIGAVAPGFQHLGEQSGHLGLIVHDEDPAAR